MRILFVAPQVPFPPDKGTKIRNLGLITTLARDHEVGLIALSDRPDAPLAAELARTCTYTRVVATPTPRGVRRRVVDLLRDNRPDLALRLYTPALRSAIRDATVRGAWDIVQFEGLETAHQGIGAVSPGASVVYDAHNAEWRLQARAATSDARQGRVIGALYSMIQASRLRRAEGAIATSASGVVVVSREDAASIRAVGSPRHLHIVPNGVDTEALRERLGQGDDGRYLFTGTMDYRPNIDGVVWFARHVWPEIKRRDPSAVFDVVGRSPVRTVRDLERVAGIVVHGETPTTRPFFERARAVVVPLLVGGGARLKVLEAFAHGVPVVSTSLGIEGINALDGTHFVAADTPRAFADAVVRLNGDTEFRARLRTAARDLVATQYDWRAIVPGIQDFYRICIMGMLNSPGNITSEA
ncbi:MAG: glycosyltransferase [Chloroflexota bacterium]|nr:MAG: glycosyltransferase [Chloroflexota bacterium]